MRLLALARPSPFREHLVAKGLSAMMEYPHCPLMSAVARMYAISPTTVRERLGAKCAPLGVRNRGLHTRVTERVAARLD
eukprot:13719737-Alexandrium_andersonii.AAC.1